MKRVTVPRLQTYQTIVIRRLLFSCRRQNWTSRHRRTKRHSVGWNDTRLDTRFASQWERAYRQRKQSQHSNIQWI